MTPAEKNAQRMRAYNAQLRADPRRWAAHLAYQRAWRAKRKQGACLFCGANLPPKHRKFCSKLCRDMSLRKSRPQKDVLVGVEPIVMAQSAPKREIRVTCPKCGKEFVARRIDTKYCSAKCWSAATRRKTPSIPATCRICGAAFMATRKKEWYCSMECYRAGHRQYKKAYEADPVYREKEKHRYRMEHGVRYACQVCGKDMSGFDNLRRNRYTCSPECKAELARRRRLRDRQNRKAKRHGNVNHRHSESSQADRTSSVGRNEGNDHRANPAATS